MAIQLKYSANTSTPSSLANGEPAYATNGEVLFIGSNNAVIAVAGKRDPGTLTANQAIVVDANSFIDEINKLYTTTARAKGLSENKVLYSHVFKNAIIPILTGFPAQFVSAFFTGSILIETIFSLDGIGLLSYEAIIQRDYPVVMGTLFIFTLLGLLTKLITDIMYVYVDPRIKFTSSDSHRNL